MRMRKRTYIQRSSGKAIFSSKMFLASKNQDKIRAAFADNANIELIQQLDEYLGDEYIALLKPEKQKNQNNGNVDNQSDISKPETTTDSETKRSGSPIKPSLREEYTNLEKDMENDADMNDVSEKPMDTNDISDTTETSGTAETVENSTTIESATTVMPISYEDAVTEIKGILNANSDTAGVSRVQKKDDEVWIFYKDSVNLNNIMDIVIETLDSASYTWMIFNRLARSDNAMVFAVLHDDTLENIPSPPVTHRV